MKTKPVPTVAIISAALLPWTAPGVVAGHVVSGSSAGHVTSSSSHSYSAGPIYGSGMHSYSGGIHYYSGGMRSYNLRSYPGGMRMSSVGGVSRTHVNYGSNHLASRNLNGYRVYSSRPVSRMSRNANRYGALTYSKRNTTATLSGQTRKNGTVNGNQDRNSSLNSASGRPSVDLTNGRNVSAQVGNTRQGNWARNNPRNRSRFDRQTQNRLHNASEHPSNFSQAQHNHSQWCHNNHGQDWWHHHCDTIIFVNLGWWGWFDGWWYPCWGYDPYYSDYVYDGPIYGYDGLPPDEVVADVQDELQRLGYYYGDINGALNPTTRDALLRYQRDHGLPVTGTVDPETVGALGLS